MNWINRQDLVWLQERLLAGEVSVQLRSLFRSDRSRVEKRWKHTHQPPVHWWDIPDIPRRWNRLITGDEDTPPHTWLVEHCLQERRGLRALSLGCGIGNKELWWAKTGAFAHLDACDLSADRIEYARGVAEQESLQNIVHYFTADVFHLQPPTGYYDVVLLEQSLHHLSPLEPLLKRIQRWLAPDGWLFLNEYVGPDRFQWGVEQRAAAQQMLDSLPMSMRLCWGERRFKEEIFRPSLARMWWSDPSESVESSRIRSLLPKFFEIIEQRDYGGNLLPLVFSDIAHHFAGDDPIARAHLQRCFALEDEWIQEHPSDFVVMACRPSASPQN